MSVGYVVLSRDPLVRGEVVNAGTSTGQLYLVAHEAGELLATLEATRPVVAVLDREHGDGEDVLARLDGRRGPTRYLLVVRDLARELVPGAHVVVLEGALRRALQLAGAPRALHARIPELLGVSVLAGALDHALEEAAQQIARGFGVDRCVISVRGDSTGGAAVGDRTWDSLAWSQTADGCRAAASSGATVVVPAGAGCESYLAVPLETPLGSHGFLGLVAAEARIFAREDRVALQAIASRLGGELGWRAVHQRTSEELERFASGPSLDPALGIWNRVAIDELAVMLGSAARRSGAPLAALVVDVVELKEINTRHGLAIGDQLLRRIADALRALVRTEDVVGRWSGDKLAVLLSGTPLEGAHRVAERLRAALDARPLALPGGERLAIPATVGIAALGPTEEAAALLARAAWSANRAQQAGAPIGQASTGPSPRVSQIDMVGAELRATLGGAYRLLHEISRGGMGVVYRAEDLALERPVAIKMLRPDLAEDRAFVEHLRGEAAMLARLQHPNLVQIYNFGQTGGDSYFVMELVEGESLQQAIERHRLEGTAMSVGDALSMIDQVASALDALHEAGIVHRDVKPANVIRDPFRGRSVLVDVGIARRYGQFSESAGTPGFVAPEVIRGRDATPRSDVYGLAAAAYNVLALASPWGDAGDVLARQCSDEPAVAPSTLRPELAPADALFARALACDPQQRPASAGAFARALSIALAALAPIPAPARPRWSGKTVAPSRAMIARTRGVVFRAVSRALGMRDTERLRDGLGGTAPDLAHVLTDSSPLAWLPTELLARLIALAPAHVEREPMRLARDLGRASVRVSFRRFFPASAATLVPARTLSAIRNVWGRYHDWGEISNMPVAATETVVRLIGSRRSPELCAWTCGMLEQLVVLSGGLAPRVDHEACEARHDDDCLFRISWQLAAT